MNTPSPILDAEERLARLSDQVRARSLPNLRPKDAATLVIVDHTGSSPRILMGKRHANHRFMPDMFVFPGGRVEAGDSRVPATGALADPVLRTLALRVSRPSITRAHAMALAAIRETFEETGIIIGQSQEVSAGRKVSQNWGDFFASGYAPYLSPLSFFARAVTPPRHARRFDTRFFVVDANHITHQVPNVVHEASELTELRWLTLAETAALPLPAITRVMLSELEIHLAKPSLSPDLTIPFYCERFGKFCKEMLSANTH